jgi:hypothetical protein
MRCVTLLGRGLRASFDALAAAGQPSAEPATCSTPCTERAGFWRTQLGHVPGWEDPCPSVSGGPRGCISTSRETEATTPGASASESTASPGISPTSSRGGRALRFGPRRGAGWLKRFWLRLLSS